MEPGDALHEVGGGVVAEVRGQVADAQSYSSSPYARSQSLGECVGCFVECGHLRERDGGKERGRREGTSGKLLSIRVRLAEDTKNPVRKSSSRI